MNANGQPEHSELGGSSYELFIGALSILSIFNLLLLVLPISEQQHDLVFIVDSWLTIIFITDFLVRLKRAPVKSQYFFRGYGWLDLIGSLPALRIFRLFRVVRVARLMREYGLRNVLHDLVHSPAEGSLLFVILLMIVTLEFGGSAVLHFEHGAPNGNITTGGDAIWWGIVTITTVGYGDFYPVTSGGRSVAVIMMFVGISLIGTFTSYLATKFLGARGRRPAVDDAPNGPRAQLEDIQRQLEEHEQASAALRAQLAEIASTLS
jgi:voltage-gated potassium channel